MGRKKPKNRALRRALSQEVGNENQIVFYRESKHLETVRGFLVAVGRRWVLLAVTSDGGYPDGHAAIRLRDVMAWRVDEESFESRFARTLPSWPPVVPHAGVRLGSAKGVLGTLASGDELLGIEQEFRFPDTIWIGRRDAVIGKWVYLLEVYVDGTWGDAPLGYKCKQVTRVSIRSQYMTALAQVAAEPPDLTTVNA
ncbi:hypothetical protein [Isoptericola croceus]|uniref:hypothetical protein n=1 Tax=Isoptericola croceus TaxID=3031406 RepID=UPI0023F74558|nr:hypothetical protein [Isoptericola croceus]